MKKKVITSKLACKQSTKYIVKPLRFEGSPKKHVLSALKGSHAEASDEINVEGEQMIGHKRGSLETLCLKENDKERWITAGSPRGIMIVILQCISSYSVQTA